MTEEDDARTGATAPVPTPRPPAPRPPAPRPPLPLPGELEPFRTMLAPYAKPAAGFGAAAGVPTVGDCHVGGHPYLPQGVPWPADVRGVPMTFLLQVNFEQTPALPGFPQTGLLQWFVGADDVLGQSLENPRARTGFDVRYFPGPSGPSVAEPGAPTPTDAEAHSPLDRPGPVAMAFAPVLDMPDWESVDTVRLQRDLPWQEVERFAGRSRADVWEPLNPQGGRIGGYPSFVQYDPRPKSGPWPLLVQLDTDEDLGVMWAGAGVGHLFGNPQRLAAGDTWDIAYHWDCG